MKRIEITKELKAELWRLFDAGHKFDNLTINGQRIPAEAVEKQRSLWADFRRRNPKK
jgi:hypothetical protein